MDKEGSFRGIFIVMLIALGVAFLWDSVDAIKNAVHLVLDPSAGWLLNWDLTIGMTLIVFVLALCITLVQKYATDQKTLKEMKIEQKKLREEMKAVKEHPEKLLELQKKQFEFLPRMMKVSMRGVMYTSIPLILFFRWFMDFFAGMEEFRFLGFLSWFWFYILGSMIFSSILRKILDVA